MPAGEVLSNADVATRIATGKMITDSAAYTTETQILTATGLVTIGKTYALWVYTRISIASGAFPQNETAQVRIREDTVLGTQLNIGQYLIPQNSGVGFTCTLYAEFTAASTVSKTFVMTAQRNSGAVNHQVRASGTSPTFLIVDLLPD